MPKSAQPERLDKQFDPPKAPKSTLEKEVPDSAPPAIPSDIEAIRFVLKTIKIEGSSVYQEADLLPLYENFIEQEVSLKKIYEIAAALSAKYRNDGYLLTRAVVPPQTIRTGEIRIQVIEGFVDDIEIKGEIEGPERILRAYANKILQSRPLRANVLERYLLLLRDLPGVDVKSMFSPSATRLGASKLTLFLEHKNLDAFATVDNRGSRFNGPIQFSFGSSLNSLLGMYERTQLQFVTASQSKELIFFNGSHEQQIGYEGTKLIVSGNFSLTQPGHTLKSLNVEGESSTISATISHPFIRARGKNLSTFFRFSSRNSETFIQGALSSRDRIRKFVLGGSYDFIDRFQGINLLGMEFSQGVDVFNATQSGTPNLSRTLGQSEFSKVTGNLLRIQQVFSKLNLLTEAKGQYSFDRLLASEEFGFGGARFGRGYDASEITGDHGLAVKVELQYAYPVEHKFLKDFQYYLFFDQGWVWQKGPLAGQDKRDSRSSVGAGVRSNIMKYVSGFIEIAKPLSDKVVAENDNDVRVFVGLTARY